MITINDINIFFQWKSFNYNDWDFSQNEEKIKMREKQLQNDVTIIFRLWVNKYSFASIIMVIHLVGNVIQAIDWKHSKKKVLHKK